MKSVPRFQGDNFYKNLELVDRLDELAEKSGVKTSQLALAWIIGLTDYVSQISSTSSYHIERLVGKYRVSRGLGVTGAGTDMFNRRSLFQVHQILEE